MTIPNLLIEEVGPQGWGVSNKLTTPPFNVPGGVHSNQGFAFQAAFNRGGIHTLTFSVSASPVDDAILLVRALAEITWSVNGHSITRMAHVGPGTSISGVAESVTCRIRDDSILSPDAVEPFPASLPYIATVVATAGPRPPSPNPPYYAPMNTMNVEFQAGDPETVIEIPSNAGINSLYIHPQGVSFDDSSLVKVRAFPHFAAWDARSFGQWLPLMPGIRKIGVQNTMPTDFRGSILFGIDG
jgi:hypothetical protein